MSKAFVIFDLDGTLIESEQVWCDVRHEFIIEHGGQWRDDAQTTMMGMRTEEWARYIHDSLHVALSPNEIANRVIELVKARLTKRVPVIPGAADALQRLAGRFTLGLATAGAPAYAKAVLATTGWDKFFSVVVYADDVKRGKPAPDVYLRALKLMKADAR
ncbi:MAG: HAD family phosphatase, partial [Candidatus Eremiobacteraeota bacterium]|nr:HAD family phosphatase [Candidatus Eremiobacteraeota bacterium]